MRGHKRPEDYTTYCIMSIEKGKTHIGIHRLISNCPDDKIVDHIDRNTLNNTKSNLSIVEHKQNMLNKRVFKNSETGIKNIYKKNNKFVVYFHRQFDTLEKAIKVRDLFINAVLQMEYPNLININNIK